MFYKDLTTREEFYSYIKDDIEFNIFDMSDEEVKLTSLYQKLTQVFRDLKVEFPKRKSQVNTILHSAKCNFEKCFDYILIPDNTAANLYLRILTENLITLKFLLENDSFYTKNWYMWASNDYRVKLSDKVLVKNYKLWLKSFKQKFNEIKDVKIEFEQLLDNKYGWAFPAMKKYINLKHLAEITNCVDILNQFEKFSLEVHSNTSLQNFRSRFDHHTYLFIAMASDLMCDYINVMYDYIKDKRKVADDFNEIYFEIQDIYHKFFTQRKKEFEKLNNSVN